MSFWEESSKRNPKSARLIVTEETADCVPCLIRLFDMIGLSMRCRSATAGQGQKCAVCTYFNFACQIKFSCSIRQAVDFRPTGRQESIRRGRRGLGGKLRADRVGHKTGHN